VNGPTQDKRAVTTEPARFVVSVAVAAVMVRDQQLKVLLVERREEPFRHWWALPSGLVRRGAGEADATLDDAARRVFAEQTDFELAPVYLTQLGSYGDAGRDPRGDSVSIAYLAVAPRGTGESKERRSSVGAPKWFPTSPLEGAKGLAFDHGRMLTDAARRTVELVETTALGLAFCHERFTVADLRHVYENIWDLPSDSLDAGNFHHRVMGLKGLLEPVSEDQPVAEAGRGRPPRKFKSGPLLRERGPAAPLERPFIRPRAADREQGE